MNNQCRVLTAAVILGIILVAGTGCPSGSGSDTGSQDTGVYYFVANDGVHGAELWKTDGTAEGTVMVADVGAPGSNTTDPFYINGVLYYNINDGVHGNEFWKSDGTAAGTVMVTNVSTVGAETYGLTEINGILVFLGRDQVNGWQLWKSDGTGTPAGTVMLTHVSPSFEFQGSLVWRINGTLYFSLASPGPLFGLWKSDGTEAGTVMVNASPPGYFINVNDKWYVTGSNVVNDVYISTPSSFNGTLYFFAFGGVGGELWKSDGASTVMVKDINPSGDSFPRDFFNLNGTVYFSANDGVSGRELWKSDGTEAGTVMVSDINPGQAGSHTSGNLAAVNGTLFFAADDGIHGAEFWKSDGTAEGTVMVKDIVAGPGGSSPHHLETKSGVLYFIADDGEHGMELWKSDGTEAGTVMVKDINPGPVSSHN